MDCMTDNSKLIRLEKLEELDIIDIHENNSVFGYKSYDYLISRLNGIIEVYNEHEDDEDSSYQNSDDDSDENSDEDADIESDDGSEESESSTIIANEELTEDLDVNQITDYNNDNDNELNPNDYVIENNIDCNLYLEAHEIMLNNVPYIGWSIYLSKIIAIPRDYKNHPFGKLTDEDDIVDKNRYLRGIIVDNYLSRNILNEIMNTDTTINDIDTYRSKLIKALVNLSY
jgi:hypothetical protein